MKFSQKSVIICLILFLTVIIYPESKVSDNLYETTLSNGLKIVVREVENSLLATSSITYNTGFFEANEFGCVELAHFLEHMLFRTTEDYASGEMVKIISGTGGNMNGYTSLINTAYECTLPANQIEKVLDIEASRMDRAVFAPDEIKTEKRVVLSEIRGYGDSPLNDFYIKISDELGLNLSYYNFQKRIDDTKAITTEMLYEFYEKYYSPKNAVLFITGGVDHKEIFRLSEEKFGTIEKGYSHQRKKLENFQITGKKYIKSSGVFSENIGHKYYNFQEFDKNSFDRVVFSFIIDTELIPELSLDYVNGYEYLIQNFTANASNILEVVDFDIIKENFDDLKERFFNMQKSEFEDIYDINNILLENYVYCGDYKYYDYLVEQYKKITYDDVIKVLYKYLDTENYLVAKFTPSKFDKNITKVNPLQSDNFTENVDYSFLREDKQENIDYYKDQVDFSYETMSEQSKKIDSLTDRIVLDNGIIIHYAKNFFNDKTYITTIHDRGIVYEKKPYVADITFRMLYEGGSQIFLKNELINNGGEWTNPYIDNYKTTHNIFARSDDLGLMAEALYKTLNKRKFHEVVLESKKENIADNLDFINNNNDQNTHANYNIEKIALDKRSAKYKRLIANENDIASITMEDIYDFYNDTRQSLNFEFYITTSLSVSEVKEIFEEKFQNYEDSINSSDSSQKELYHYKNTTHEKIVSKNLKNTHENIVLFIQPFEMDASNLAEEKAALDLSFSILSGTMSSRLFDEIRNQLGYTYSIFSNYRELDFNSSYYNWIYFMVNSPKLEKGIKVIKNEFRDFAENGPTETELYFNKNILINNLAFKTQTSRDLHRYLVYSRLFGIPNSEILKMIKELSAGDLIRIFKDKINPEHYYISIAGPYK